MYKMISGSLFILAGVLLLITGFSAWWESEFSLGPAVVIVLIMTIVASSMAIGTGIKSWIDALRVRRGKSPQVL